MSKGRAFSYCIKSDRGEVYVDIPEDIAESLLRLKPDNRKVEIFTVPDVREGEPKQVVTAKGIAKERTQETVKLVMEGEETPKHRRIWLEAATKYSDRGEFLVFAKIEDPDSPGCCIASGPIFRLRPDKSFAVDREFLTETLGFTEEKTWHST